VNGIVSGSSDEYYDSEQNVTLLAIASSGYGFTGWSGDLSGTTNPTSVNMDTPKDVTANFTAIPGATSLVSPSGTIFISAPTYTWNAVAESTWYYLWVTDSTGVRIQQWYTAADAGCGSGTGTCSVTPAVALAAGAHQWKVQTYSSGGYGPWTSPMSFTVSLPGAATLASPSGDIADTTPTYTWNAGSGASWYHLLVNDSAGSKIQKWYTAAELGCPNGAGICSITPTTEVLGSCQWWVQTWNSVGYGSWSAPLSFTTPIPMPPSEATLLSPSGEIATTTPTYIWNPVSDASWYCLYVNDSSGNKINQWYAASDAGCPDGAAGTCSVTPSVALAPGAGQWYIRAYNSAGNGPWSAGKSFLVLTQSLYDDFSGASINKDKWGQGELVREIQGGKLISKATAYGSRVINNLDFRNPASIAYIEADVTIDRIEGDYDPDDSNKYSVPNARLAGFFYNDGTASGAGSHRGEVQGVIRIVLSQGGLKAEWVVWKSLNDEASQGETLGSGIFSDPISLNISYKLSIQFEPSLKRFTFKLGTSVLTWTSTDVINPSNTPWKSIGTDIDFFPAAPSPYYGKVSAIFDNLMAKDETGSVVMSDDFSSLTLDSTKWETYEWVREISAGRLRSKVRSSSATTSSVSNDLEFLNPSPIDMVQLKITPVAYQNSQGANVVARLAGDYYNDGTGTGTPGDHRGDVTAQLLIGGTGINPVAFWVVSRSTDSAGQVPETLASWTFTTPITLGNTYTLSLWWDGSRFIFRINNEETTYTPTTSIKPPKVPWKSIGTQVLNSNAKEATIEALFDDVVAYYTPPSAATLVSPSGTIKDTTPTYTWNAVPEAMWYQLYVNDSTGKKIQQWYLASALGCASGAGTCSVTPTTEVIGSCQWWVQTYNPAGFGPWSTPLSFTIPPPVAATLVSPSGTITDTTPTYTWNAVPDSTWYQLYVNDDAGNKIQQWYSASAVGCASGTGICSVTPTIEVLGACQWWVRTYNPAGFGPWSVPLLFTTPIPAIPVATTLISPSGTITDTTPTYTWNAVSDSTWYQLYVNDVTGNKIHQWYTAAAVGCASGTGTCSVTPTIEVFGACQWWVQTYSGGGFGPWSAPLSFTTPIPNPPPAAILISPSGTINNLKPAYTWSAVSTATDYLLRVSDSTGNKIYQWYTAAASGCGSGSGTCSVTPDTTLSQGTHYQWSIQTKNPAGTGPWSNSLSFTTPGWI
jgi:uncharacterized repeat protein (TIGR02543 family)